MSTPPVKPGNIVKEAENAAGGMGIGKGLLVAAGATAALYAVSQIMKGPETSPRRIRENNSNDDLIFTGQKSVGVGAISMPIPGQQQQMGSWRARMQQGPQGPSVPTR